MRLGEGLGESESLCESERVGEKGWVRLRSRVGAKGLVSEVG